MQRRLQDIGGCQLDYGRLGVVREGHFYRLEPRDFAVLRQLVENAPNVVSAKALIRAGWAGKVVGDNVLHQSIGRLRKVLADDARHARFIETLAKQGYRFLAPVAPRKDRPGGVIDVQPIAVLPFKDYSRPASDAYLVDGLCFEICHQFMSAGLQVIGLDLATQDRRRRLSDVEYALSLGAQSVLSGLLVVNGSRLRAHVVLSEAESGRQMWSAKHDYTDVDVLDIHTLLAAAVVQGISNAILLRKGPRASGIQQIAPQVDVRTHLVL